MKTLLKKTGNLKKMSMKNGWMLIILLKKLELEIEDLEKKYVGNRKLKMIE